MQFYQDLPFLKPTAALNEVSNRMDLLLYNSDERESDMSAEPNPIVQSIVTELAELPDEKVIEVLDFVRFLRVRYSTNAKRYAPREIDEERWAQLYAESAEEDIQLAEEGMGEYESSLKREDASE
jgi:hypothetical protein